MLNDTGSLIFQKPGIPLALTSVLLAAMSLLSVVGNTLVCIAVFIQPRLRELTYYPVLSLAFADLLCALVAMPSYLLKKFTFDATTEMIICDVFRFSYFFTEYASVLSLTVISAERFVTIRFPLRWHKEALTKKFVALLIVAWMEAAFVSSMPFYWQHSGNENCSYKPKNAWSIMVIIIQVVLPYLLIALSYCSIYSVVRRHEKHIGIHSVKLHAQLQSSGYQGSRARTNNSVTWKAEKKSTFTLTLVLGLFVVCWGPSTIYYFLLQVCPECFTEEFDREAKPFVNAVVKLLTFSNSCFNPVIYCWRSKEFRAGFVRVVCRKWTGWLPCFSSTPRADSRSRRSDNNRLAFAACS